MTTWELNPKRLVSVCCFLAPNGKTASISTSAEAVRANFVDRGNVFKNINVKFGEKTNKETTNIQVFRWSLEYQEKVLR